VSSLLATDIEELQAEVCASASSRVSQVTKLQSQEKLRYPTWGATLPLPIAHSFQLML